MANIKISELNELETKNGEDLLAIVDTNNNETKKIKVETLAPENFELELIADEEPQYGALVQGECYYNTTTNKIYRYVGGGTYVDLGEPKTGILYIIFSEKATYAYDGETMVSVGGGSGSEIVIGDETEATEDTKLIIEEDDMNLDLQGSDFLNEYSESTEKGYSCDYTNNQLDNKQNGVWTLLQDNVSATANVDLSNIDFNELYVVIRNTTDAVLAITQNIVKSDLTDTIKWYRNGYYYNAQVNSAVAVRASLTQINFTDYYVNNATASAKMTVYYR